MHTTIAIDIECSKHPALFPWQPGAFLVAVGIAFETGFRKSWVFNHNENQLYSIANMDGVGICRSFDCQRDMLSEIQAYIFQANRLVGHNLKFDLNWLHSVGLNTSHCKYWCTQVTEYLLRGQREIGRLTLEDLSKQYLNTSKIDRVKMMWDAGYETSDIPLNVLIPYLEQDCINTLAIYQRQVPAVKADGLSRIVALRNESSRVLSAIECNGMQFDLMAGKKHAEALSDELHEIDASLQEALRDAGVSEINLNSNDELSAALFGGIINRESVEMIEKERWATKKEPYTFVYKDGRTTTKYRNKRYREKYQTERKCIIKVKHPGAGFVPPKGSELKKQGYYSTSKDTVKQLVCKTKTQKNIKKWLRDRSRVAKALESLIGKNPEEHKGLINKVMPDGCVHPQYNQTIAKTGRLSSKDPNGQNIPREGTSPLKKCFIPRYDYILDVDLSSIEWRAAAFLSRDPIMIKEILAGVDPHTENAINIFGADPDGDLKKFEKLRTIAKIVTFRLLYGGSAYGFYLDSKMPNWSLKRWRQIVDAFYAKYKVLQQWQENNIALVYKNKGILRNPTGRKFVFYKGEKGYKPSQIKNFPVQSLATADIMPLCMVIIHREFIKRGFMSLIIGQVHDSLIFDCVKKEMKPIATMCIQIMEDLPKYIEEYFGFEFDIPLGGNAEASAVSWGDTAKLF